MSPYLICSGQQTCLGKVARKGAQMCLGGAAQSRRRRNAPAPSYPWGGCFSLACGNRVRGCPDHSLLRRVKLSASWSHALCEYISHVIRKINNNKKRASTVGLGFPISKAASQPQSAPRAAAAITSVSGVAARRPPHPFSSGFVPFLLPAVNPPPCRGACFP